MNRLARSWRFGFASLVLWTALLPGRADDRVILIATASEEYSRRRVDASGQPRVESYVLMEGKTYEGIVSDRSVEKMSFRQIAEFLAPELAKQHYVPTRDTANADLLLIVHRGTTIPRVTDEQTRGIVVVDPSGGVEAEIERFKQAAMMASAGAGTAAALFLGGSRETYWRLTLDTLARNTDKLSNASREQTNSHLLGYGQQLNRMSRNTISSHREDALRLDLETERYFLIIRAYDLKGKPRPGTDREPVWVLYVNMGTTGQNFVTAVSQMSVAANDYFGRSTDGVQTIRPGRGNVRLAPLELKDEVPARAVRPPPASKQE